MNRGKAFSIELELVLIYWKTEAYRRKPILMDTLTAEQKKTFNLINSIYETQIEAHPADYKKFISIFEKSFKYYL